MDIALTTNTEDPALAFRGIELFGDGSGIGCTLEMRSGWMSASYHFVVEAFSIQTFLEALRELDRTLAGDALLKPQWEEQHIRLSGDGLGRISVSGDLIEHGPNRQRVHFEFATDQTCLGPLIRDFVALMNSARPAA